MENQTNSRKLCNVHELAKICSVTSRTIHNWSEEGLIPTAVRIGKTLRFDKDSVLAALVETTERNQRMVVARRKAKKAAATSKTASHNELQPN